MSERAWRTVALTTAMVVWTLLALGCAGLVAMSGAHSTTGEWPLGATIALGVVGVGWAVVPVFIGRQLRRQQRSEAAPDAT